MRRGLRSCGLAAKLLVAFVVVGALCAAAEGVFALRTVRPEVASTARQNLEAITRGVLAMCQVQQDLLSKTLDNDLRITKRIIAEYGGNITEGPQTTLQAIDQVTGQSTMVQVPTWRVGPQPIHGDSTIVDRVRDLTADETTCTIFQRTEPGLLWVSTNVKRNDGTRAVGTYIPVSSPVTQAVLRGETYRGIANVMGKPYVAVYEPLRGPAGQVIGALYVGVPQDSVTSLRQGIMDIKVGATGYAFVLDSQGNYVVSAGGKRDGENILETKDATGRPFIKEICDPQSEARRTGWIRYAWKNDGEDKARMKLVRLVHFEPWDWIIGAGSYEDEINSSVHAVS
ncbi:MAG TPA: Cache 3/Cache 2 fusion domain-containing protein, partial [Armatimonadota bacterium]|nr:Cache 3/Cache 2 fusion domain-containing protein [Armatimonadota bacterium]